MTMVLCSGFTLGLNGSPNVPLYCLEPNEFEFKMILFWRALSNCLVSLVLQLTVIAFVYSLLSSLTVFSPLIICPSYFLLSLLIFHWNKILPRTFQKRQVRWWGDLPTAAFPSLYVLNCRSWTCSLPFSSSTCSRNRILITFCLFPCFSPAIS